MQKYTIFESDREVNFIRKYYMNGYFCKIRLKYGTFHFLVIRDERNTFYDKPDKKKIL